MTIHRGGVAMKTTVSYILVILSIVVAGSAALAGEQRAAPAAHSKDFDRMKLLVGVWEGKTDMGKGMEPFKVTYELTSGGNAIVEKFAAGQPHEMVTVYYDYNGKLVLTHYCALGNQPHMEVTSSGDDTLQFILSEKTPNLVSLKEMHMHAHGIILDGKDSMTQTWTLYDKGVRANEVAVKLTRTM
jgi:hypothetical protein